MASLSAVKAYDILLAIVHRNGRPSCNATADVFGMDNISAPIVLGAWQGIFQYKILTAKQIVEAIQQNRLESVFKDCCSKLATVNHHYALKALERYRQKTSDPVSDLIISFGLFNLRPETTEESIKAFKNYFNDLADFAEEREDTGSYRALVAAGIRVPKALAAIELEMQALVDDFESTIASMQDDMAAKATEALMHARGQ